MKEMDIGWWDPTKSTLFLLELKGNEVWQGFDKNKDIAHDHLVKSLKKKATDVLLMLAAVWVKTNIGKKIRPTLPKPIHRYRGDGSIKIIFLVDTPTSSIPLLLAVKDAVNKEIAGRVRLFGVKNVTLINFDEAQNSKLPIERYTKKGSAPTRRSAKQLELYHWKDK
ncbi:MAG: hypothetical protein ACE5G9_12345 [Nitrospinales bacterium]